LDDFSPAPSYSSTTAPQIQERTKVAAAPSSPPIPDDVLDRVVAESRKEMEKLTVTPESSYAWSVTIVGVEKRGGTLMSFAMYHLLTKVRKRAKEERTFFLTASFQ
jgi:hypothetical protein